MIKKIILENFKAFQYAEIDIKPITILVGPNNGGKTSLLRSISLIQQTLRGSSADVLKLRGAINFGDFNDIFHQNSENKEIRFRFDFDDNKYFDVKFKNEKNKIIVKDFSCNNGEFEYNIENIQSTKNAKEEECYVPANLSINYKYKKVLERLSSHANIDIYRENFFFLLQASILDKDLNILINKIIKTLNDEKFKETDPELPNFIKVLTFILNLQKDSNDFYQSIKQEFDNLNYIGPIRAVADRNYGIGSYDNVGFYGEHAVQIIEENTEIHKETKRIFKKLGIANDFEVSTLPNQKNFEFKFKTDITESGVNFADVGCGSSQILPIIVQSLYAPDDSMIIIEQPEVHLHPKIQADLAGFLVESISSNKKFLIETHSEYFIERIRTCIMKNPVLSEKVLIYYIDQNKDKKQSEIIKIEINPKGQYSTLPEGYLTNIRLEEIDAQIDISSGIFL